MATIKRIGYGQVEPNHLSAQRTGQIYAQLPADEAMEILENGQYVKYDYAKGKVDLTGNGEWMLVFNEIKLYDEREQMYKDYAMKKTDFVEKVMVPRVFKTNVGDIYTTNCIKTANTSNTAEVEGEDLKVGDFLNVDAATGYLKKGTNSGEMVWEVSKVYTMADGQPAVKIVRIK